MLFRPIFIPLASSSGCQIASEAGASTHMPVQLFYSSVRHSSVSHSALHHGIEYNCRIKRRAICISCSPLCQTTEHDHLCWDQLRPLLASRLVLQLACYPQSSHMLSQVLPRYFHAVVWLCSPGSCHALPCPVLPRPAQPCPALQSWRQVLLLKGALGNPWSLNCICLVPSHVLK